MWNIQAIGACGACFSPMYDFGSHQPVRLEKYVLFFVHAIVCNRNKHRSMIPELKVAHALAII